MPRIIKGICFTKFTVTQYTVIRINITLTHIWFIFPITFYFFIIWKMSCFTIS